MSGEKKRKPLAWLARTVPITLSPFGNLSKIVFSALFETRGANSLCLPRAQTSEDKKLRWGFEYGFCISGVALRGDDVSSAHHDAPASSQSEVGQPLARVSCHAGPHWKVDWASRWFLWGEEEVADSLSERSPAGFSSHPLPDVCWPLFYCYVPPLVLLLIVFLFSGWCNRCWLWGMQVAIFTHVLSLIGESLSVKACGGSYRG